jgi:hypothetical protein
MVRTRDFVLFLGLVAFLLVGIGTTLVRDEMVSPAAPAGAAAVITATAPGETPAFLASPPVDVRAARLARLREAIVQEAGTDALASPPAKPAAPSTEPSAPETSASPVPTEPYWRCESFERLSISPWRGAAIKEIEGARIVYRKNEESLSSASGAAAPPRETLLQLPIFTHPSPSPSCIGTDIVGVALDGAFIRNDEHALYAVFGPETLIGFALDGFPIYGTNDTISLDRCGGAVVGGGYRYHLSSRRAAVIGCFAAAPRPLTR